MDIFSSILQSVAPYLIGGALTIVGMAAKNLNAKITALDQSSIGQDLLPQGGEDEKPATSRPGAAKRHTASES
jgi:hypothetical protein